MKTVKNILDKITSYASVFIFIMMVLMVTYQVIARYIFSAPSSVTEILTRYAFVWLIIISATYMFGQREHINIGVTLLQLINWYNNTSCRNNPFHRMPCWWNNNRERYKDTASLLRSNPYSIVTCNIYSSDINVPTTYTWTGIINIS